MELQRPRIFHFNKCLPVPLSPAPILQHTQPGLDQHHPPPPPPHKKHPARSPTAHTQQDSVLSLPAFMAGQSLQASSSSSLLFFFCYLKKCSSGVLEGCSLEGSGPCPLYPPLTPLPPLPLAPPPVQTRTTKKCKKGKMLPCPTKPKQHKNAKKKAQKGQEMLGEGGGGGRGTLPCFLRAAAACWRGRSCK